MAVLESGSRAYGGLIKATVKEGVLVLDFADADRRTADCCSDGFVRVRYKWNGKQFSQVGSVERGEIAEVAN
jgi:hypothetical protein